MHSASQHHSGFHKYNGKGRFLIAPCCFNEGAVCYPPDRRSSAPAGCEASCTLAAPSGPQEGNLGIPHSWDAPEASAGAWQMWPGTRCTSARLGAAGGWAEAPGTPEKLADICLWADELLSWGQHQSQPIRNFLSKFECELGEIFVVRGRGMWVTVLGNLMPDFII